MSSESSTRADGRAANQLRPIRFVNHIAPYATGSTLIEWGNTRVICGITVEETVPRWMKEQNVSGGWITAEYSMLPYSTLQRKQRDISKGKIDGRSQEIQRLIGRAIRAAVDLEKLGPRTLWVDCDVLQADGGTRTAAITGSFVALNLAMRKLIQEGKLASSPITTAVAAVSVGIVEGQDRKSTRLNSSHGYSSYAVFCLKKKIGTRDHGIQTAEQVEVVEELRSELNPLLVKDTPTTDIYTLSLHDALPILWR